MGVVEQRFDLPVDGEAVPGIRWHPEGAQHPRPTILVGHRAGPGLRYRCGSSAYGSPPG